MLERLLAFMEDVDIRGTLFVIPQNHSSEEGYLRLLKRAKASGHEIAMHGCSHTNNEFGYIIPIPLPTLARQSGLLKIGKQCLEMSLGGRVLGFRAPSYRHSKITFKALERLDFKYDSSKTVYKPTHGFRFRFRTCFPPVLTKIGSLFEIPVTADYTYDLTCVLFPRLLKLAEKDFEWVSSLDGIYVVNNHVGRFGNLGFSFLRALIDKVRPRTDFAKLEDLVRGHHDR
jgi:peptidoglycan/xylan/chitin deacetylase (PgdA/CDA1 family)